MMLEQIRIVMVNTTHAGNIGAAARAMKNMGLSQLVLVDPIAELGEEATSRASRADDVLEKALVVGTLEEAIADCHWVVGTSARSRHIPWPLISPRACAAKARQLSDVGTDEEQPVIALVFGRESRGLTNEELHLCHAHVHIPTVESFSSLNVAQAIQVLCYEMRLADLERASESSEHLPWGVEWDHPPATHEQMNGMIQHLEQTLVDIGFLDPNTPKQLMTRLRRLYQRAAPDRMEINILRGMLSAVQRLSHSSNTASRTDSKASPHGDSES
jgi:tRNA (cytidine32/uridine32-2'-O)-methyltransferase